MRGPTVLAHIAARRPIPADDGLPQLALVLDEERILPLIAEALNESLAAVAIEYVRYKPGTSCLVLYRAELEDGAHCYAYSRVTAFQGEHEAYTEAALTRPNLHLDVMRIVGDRRIRGLRALCDRGARAAMLARLVREDRREPYVAGWGRWDVIRYKPERRAVLTGARDDGRRYYVRLYAGKEGERTGTVVRALRDSVSCVSALGHRMRYSQSFRALLTDEVPEKPLSDGAPEHAAAAAGALYLLHRCPADCVGGAAIPPAAVAARAVAGLHAVLPELRPQARVLAEEILPRLCNSPAPPRLIHGDFDASQVLVEDQQAHLIDFDKTRPGDPSEDVASLVARLAGRTEARSLGTAICTAATFIESYERAQGRPLPEQALAAWIALYLLQMAVEPFRRFEPEWPQGCRRILALAERALRGELL